MENSQVTQENVENVDNEPTDQLTDQVSISSDERNAI